MAYLMPDATSILTRTTGLVSAASDYTCVFTLTTNANTTVGLHRTPFAVKNAGYTQYARVNSTTGLGNAYRLQISNGVSTLNTSSFGQSANSPRTYAYVREGTTHRFFRRSAGGIGLDTVTSLTLDLSGATWSEMMLGNDLTASSETSHAMSYFREWSRALNTNELAMQINGSEGVPDAALVADTPLLADLSDISGEGHPWTSGGTAGTFVNSIPATVIDISAETFPFTTVITPTVFNVANEVWFTFTTPVATWLGAGLSIPDVENFEIELFASDGTSSVSFLYGTPGSTPISAGTYYLRIRQTDGDPIAENMTVQFEQLGLLTELPGCAGIINDDTDGFGGIAFDMVSGTYLGFLNQVPSGELAATLPDGTTLWHDKSLVYHQLPLVVLDANLNMIASVDTTPTLGALSAAACIAASATMFYVLRAGTNTVWTVTSTGVITATGNTVVPHGPAVKAIGVNPDGTRLYWAEGTASPYHIYTWNLTTNTEEAILYATDISAGSLGLTSGNNLNGEILVLPDGSAVFSGKQTGDMFSLIYWVNSSGALVDQFVVDGTYFLVNHMAFAGSGTHIYVWRYDTNADNGLVSVLDLATGTFTDVITSPMFDQGQNFHGGLQSIGISSSCQFVVFNYSECTFGPEPPEPPGPGEPGQPFPIRWVLRTPVIT